MGILKNGKLKGKLGKMVGFRLNGRDYVRSAPVRTAPPSEAELLNRFLLELMTRWLRPIITFLRLGFRNYSRNFEGFNAAFSVNYKEALIRNGYESHIDPSLVKVSFGDLGLPDNLQVTLNSSQELEFSWSPAINQGPRDRALLLAYDPENKQAHYDLSGPIRHKGTARLPLSPASHGTFYIYAAFIAEDGTRQSDSKYLGSVSIE